MVNAGPPPPPLPPARCPHCGGSDVATGLQVSQSAEVGRIGLTYRTALIFRNVEQLKADLCRNCGTVLRFFVAEPKRPWWP